MNQIGECCWVCGARFITSNPPGSAICEVHHVVPRAYGGQNGPLVGLCDTCHSKVHKLSNGQDLSLLNGLGQQGQTRLKYLAQVIINAKSITNSDPNKLLPVSFKITKEEAQKLEILKSVLGVKSRRDVYKIAVDKLFSKL